MSKIQFLVWSQLQTEEKQRILRRTESNIDDLLPYAQKIIETVRNDGDKALIELNRRFDAPDMSMEQLRAQPADFVRARNDISPELLAALHHAHDNIRRFHEKQLPEPLWFTEVQPGIMAGEKITPIASVGLYVPRGKGSFPSVMLMLATPAKVAGVERVVVTTPPSPTGQVDAATLLAAEICGIDEVYAVGGIQALAALAYGTETIPNVSKVVGPGSGYVAAAKRALHGVLDVGAPAGPSEAIILCDEYADPVLAAMDILVEAEHGPDSAALLVTHSRALAEAIQVELPNQIEKLPDWRQEYVVSVLSTYGGIVLTEDLVASIEFVNDYAPEHLLVLVQEPFGLLNRLKHAGEILLGPRTPIPFANYCLGLNAILPTGGFARSFSSVSVWDFLKRTGVGYVTEQGFDQLAQTTTTLADYEGFPAHAEAIRGRIERWKR